jgi:DNA repair exonuclease SbcCD ATPase subunit
VNPDSKQKRTFIIVSGDDINMVGIRGMVDNNSGGYSNRYRKISGFGVLDRIFFWENVQSEIISAENEYLEIAGSLSAVNKNIEQLKHEIIELTAKYNQATVDSSRLSERLAEETSAHELLMDSYEINTKSWAEDGEFKESTIHKQEEIIVSQKGQISRLEANLADAIRKTVELELSLAQKEHELSEKIERCTTLTSKYTALLQEKKDVLDRLSSSEEIIASLSVNFEENCRFLTEIRRLETVLASREVEVVQLKQELNALRNIKAQILTKVNRMAFAIVQTDSRFRQKQEQLNEELVQLSKEIDRLEHAKQLLQSALSAKQQTLSTYAIIIDEILEEWKKHSDQTKICVAEATGIVPAAEKYGFLAQINGHHVLFAVFTPTSYEDLRSADGLICEISKKLTNLVESIDCRKEVFVVVPDECMMYLTKCLYASPLCSVQVITPSQVVAAVRTISRFVVYEKTQIC